MKPLAGRTLIVATVLVVVLTSCGQWINTSCLSNRSDLDLVSSAFQSRAYSAYQDTRPDLSLNPGDLYITRNGNNVTGGMYGMHLKIFATARNIGESPANDVWLRIGVRNVTHYLNQTLFDQGYSNLDSNITSNSIEVAVDFSLGYFLPGILEIWACVDTLNLVNESNENNNLATLEFTIAPLQTDVVILTDKVEYSPEDMMFVTATVRYSDTTDPVSVPLSFYLVDKFGDIVPGTETSQTMSDGQGEVTVAIFIPSGIENGLYHIGVKVLDEPRVSSSSVEISRPDPRIVLAESLAIAILIIGAVVAVIALALKWMHRREKR